MAFDHVGYFQVAVLFPVCGFEHGECAGESGPASVVPVEPVHDKDVPPVNEDKLGFFDVQSRPPGQGEFQFFPAGDIPVVAARARELRDGQAPGVGDDGGLGPGTAQGAARVDEIGEVTVGWVPGVELVGGAQQPGHRDQAGDRLTVS
ncbi:MAG TPA: hypothetical protein VGI74_15695 [Streptosporangiaceae bacterium]